MHGGGAAHRHPSQTIHPHSRGHRRPPASGHLWQQVSVHSGGQVLPLARGTAHARHHRRHLRRHPHTRLDLQIQSTGAADLGPGHTVHLGHLGRPVPAAGHPASADHCLPPPGMVERCHWRLKDALRARLAGPDWPLHLPWVLMGLRAAPTEDTGVPAAEIVFITDLGTFMESHPYFIRVL
jgi:hypothetical protein